MAKGHMRPLTDSQFARWSHLFAQRTGIDLGPRRRVFLETQLRMRMREAGYDDYDAYFDYVTGGRQGIPEWVRLVDRITVHETGFNRHPSSLALLRTYLDAAFPSRQAGDRIRLDLLSIGCATGEEAYSLAMVLDKFCRERRDRCYYAITATDISRGSLETARRGVYTAERLRKLDAEDRATYFEPVDNDLFKVSGALTERICFTQLNVLDLSAAPFGQMDVIYCQNVLIYFSQTRRTAILNDMAERLKPDGMLVIGAGEALGWMHPNMERIAFKDTLAYRRVAV